MRRLLAHPVARVYLLGQVFSLFGDSCLSLAMGIWIKTLTGSNAAAGLMFFFVIAPSLLAPASGLVVDRVRRRRLLMATNAATGAAVLLLTLVQDRHQIWLIYAVMAVCGFAYTLFAPAEAALLSTALPSELLPDANAAMRTMQESMRLIGPIAGAGLFTAVGGHVIAIIDAATFVVPIACLATLRIVEPKPVRPERHWVHELAGGAAHIWHTSAAAPDRRGRRPGHRRLRLRRDDAVRHRRRGAAPHAGVRRRAGSDAGRRRDHRRPWRAGPHPATR